MKKIIIAEKLLPLFENNGIFKRGGITLVVAHSSEEIVDLHGVNNVHLIITNQNLPLMGAENLCVAIRRHDQLKKVSLVVTSDTRGESGAKCLEAGANAFIPAPVDPVALFSTISELLLVPPRKDIRVLLRASIKGREGNVPFFAALQNVSISGMMLETDRSLAPGDQMACSFNIAHSEINASCTVMRADRASSGRYCYGVKFLNLDTKSLIIIEHFVKARARQ